MTIFELEKEKGLLRFARVTDINEADDESNIRDYFKKWPYFYYFISNVFGHLWWSGVSPKEFLKRFDYGKINLNIGSGPRIIDKKVINIDIFPYKGVSIVADISNLPFKDLTVDRVLCDTVLEHVKDPVEVVREVNRVLSKSGLAYFTVPFLYPFHSSPSDYGRWTHEGLRKLMDDFEIEEIGVYAGPFSSLTVWLSYMFASIFSFGSLTLYWLLVNLSMFLFFPLKFLDIFAARLPFAVNISSVLYVIVRKKH